MRNFDQEQNTVPTRPLEDRAFVLGGETLHYRDRIPGEVMTNFGQIDADTPVMQDMQKLGGMIFDLVEPEDRDALNRALSRREPPMVDMAQLAEVIGWILGEATNRPLEPSSDSGGSAASPPSTPGLTDASRLQAAGV